MRNLNSIIVAFCILSLYIFSAMACDIDRSSGFFPKSNSQIPLSEVRSSFKKENYLEMIEKFNELYSSIVKEKGAKLDIINLWDDGEINAYAHRQKGESTFSIEIMGGLARHPLMTKDVFALVLCHELGHHLGGAPKKSPIEEESQPGRSDRFALFGFPGKKPKAPKVNWSSTEGQADYFGALKCMRKYYEYENKIAPLADIQVPAYVEESCKNSFANEYETLVCKKVAMAGFQMAKIFKSLKTMSEDISFEAPSKTVVKSTIEAYPTVQCRLDTFFQAALCDKDANLEVSNTDANTGVCANKDGSKGARPLCWFRPQ